MNKHNIFLWGKNTDRSVSANLNSFWIDFVWNLAFEGGVFIWYAGVQIVLEDTVFDSLLITFNIMFSVCISFNPTIKNSF